MTEPVIRETRHGTVLYDAREPGGYDATWFDRAHWQRHGAELHSKTGRGGVLIWSRDDGGFVLRHYHRGGLVARLVFDHYLWLGLERTRSFREWRMLADLHAEGFPVPRPVAARVVRQGPIYQADIVVGLLAKVRPLSAHLVDGNPAPERWRAIGAMVRRFHDRGVDHPDLTAHNILLDDEEGVFLVDFDNAVVRAPGAWRDRGVARLERSLRKVALETGVPFDAAGLKLLTDSYRAGRPG